MGRETAFLDRLATLGQRRPPAEEDLDVLMESVRSNLVRLLNSRWRMCETLPARWGPEPGDALPEYGLPALVDLSIGKRDHAQTVEKGLKNAIDAFEPRLRNARVSRIVPDEVDAKGMLSFRITGQLRTGTGDDASVWYETEVTRKGDFGVAG